MLAKPGMVVLAIVFVAMGSIFGATDVVDGRLRRRVRVARASPASILAVFALGSLISGLLYGTRQWKRPLYLRFATGVVALAVGVCFFFLVQSLVALAAVMFVAGFAIAPTLINGNGLVQDLVPARAADRGADLGGHVARRRGVGRVVHRRARRSTPHGSHAGFLVVVVVRRVRRRRDARRAAAPCAGDAGEHVHDSVEAGSPSATGGAAVAACEIAESVEPARSVGTLGRVIDALATLVAPARVPGSSTPSC